MDTAPLLFRRSLFLPQPQMNAPLSVVPLTTVLVIEVMHHKEKRGKESVRAWAAMVSRNCACPVGAIHLWRSLPSLICLISSTFPVPSADHMPPHGYRSERWIPRESHCPPLPIALWSRANLDSLLLPMTPCSGPSPVCLPPQKLCDVVSRNPDGSHDVLATPVNLKLFAKPTDHALKFMKPLVPKSKKGKEPEFTNRLRIRLVVS